jgi:hypothetical protein
VVKEKIKKVFQNTFCIKTIWTLGVKVVLKNILEYEINYIKRLQKNHLIVNVVERFLSNGV